MNEYAVLDLIYETADAIADYYGQNVPYCESMDMTLFPQPIHAMLDDGKADLEDLQFLAYNGTFFPEGYDTATLDEFRAYCLEHREEILSEIEAECKHYQESLA